MRILAIAGSETVSLGLSTSGVIASRSPNKKWIHSLWSFVIPDAYAVDCSSGSGLGLSSCISSSRTTTYSCTTKSGNNSVTGAALLNYSDASCTYFYWGNILTRVPALILTTDDGLTRTTSSATHSDYRGNSMGGGSQLTHYLTYQTLSILGLEYTWLDASNQVLAQLSARSTASIIITGDQFSNYSISEGSFEIANNTSEYVTTWVPAGVTWSSGCSCPTGGTLNGTLSGSKTGTVALAFTSTCGSASFTDPESSVSTLTLDHCGSL